LATLYKVRVWPFLFIKEIMDKVEFKTLSPEEIQTLEVDAALRLIGEYTVLLSRMGRQIGEAIIEKGKAEVDLSILRNDKQTLIEMLRGLKVICERA
jgi:hypothetical protein